MLWVVIKAAN